jgi:hypothetical protein
MNDDDDNMATSQTPPSLQTRVGGAVFYALQQRQHTHVTTPPSLQMRVGGAVLLCITTTPLHTHVMTPPSLQT